MARGSDTSWGGIPRRSIEELLNVLVQARSWSDAAPTVTLLLRSGKGVTGHLLHSDDDVVVLEEGTSLVTLARKAVIGVRVHEAAEAIEVLSGGTVEQGPGDDTPTRAHLRRDVQALEARWAQELGGTLSLSLEADLKGEGQRISLQRLLHDLEAAVAIVGLPFVEAVDRVVISDSDAPGAERVERDLWLGVDLGGGRLGRWESAVTLAKALRAALSS